MKKFILAILLVLLVTVASGEFQWTTFDNVADDGTLEIILRERLSLKGDTFTFSNGLTIDNVTNNALELNENSEDLIATFGSDIITWSTTTSAVWSFGTMIPNLDGLDVDSYIYFNPTTAPATTEGYVYYDLANHDLRYRNNSGWVSLTSGTGDNTLDAAYDQGGSGSGRRIDATDGAVDINSTDADAAFLLTVRADPCASAALGGVQITSGSDSTEDSVQVANSGSGYSISTDSDAFTVDSSGNIIGNSLDTTGGNIVLQNDMILDQSANNTWKWTENGEDIVWTFSADTITTSSTTDVVSIDWGALAPTFGAQIVASAGMAANDDITLANGKALQTNTTSGHTAKIQVYDNDTGPGYKDAITLTNGNTPAMSLGGNAMTVAVDSSDWDISVTGAMTGIGAITSDGLLTAALGATISGATVNLNASSNFAVNIGTGTTTGAVAVGGTGTQTLNIGNGAGAKTVNLGSATGASATAINAGTGDLTLTSVDDTTINGGSAGSVINIGLNTQGNVINIATDDTTLDDLNIGSVKDTVSITGVDVTVVSGATGVLVNKDTNQLVGIATGTSTGTVTIGGAAAQTIAIGDGAAAKTVSLGSSNSTSTTTILSGSNAVNINVDVNEPVNIGSGTCEGTVTIGGAAAQTITIGNGAAAKTVTLGSSNSTSTTNILAGSGNINITGSVVRTAQQYVQSIANCKVGSGSGWLVGAADDVSLATLPASETASILIVPITIPLKVGWTITAFSLNGQIDSAGNTATLDADLRKHTEATAGYSDASIGAITQISETGDYKVVDSKGSLAEVVAADESYYLLITGTTAASTDIEIASITVTVSEI